MKIWPEFWIAHPAADSNPVSLMRWLKWRLSEWLGDLAHDWKMDALEPGWREKGDDIPF